MKTKEQVDQGKGTADHLMPLGYLFMMGHYLLSSVAPDQERNDGKEKRLWESELVL